MNDRLELPQYRAVTMQSRGCLYDIQINVQEHQFYLTVEKDESFERWSCIFDHEAVRAITEHVKSSKTYKIFVGMLLLAIEQSEIMQGEGGREPHKNRQVAIQIFTQQQLKKLDYRMQDPGDEKLYVVLTYKTEVENSFYVLPLIKIQYSQDQDSNEQYLFQQYKKVKSELVSIKQQNMQMQQSFKQKIQEIKQQNEQKQCINCDVLTQEMQEKDQLILQLQEEKDQMLKTLQLVNEGKAKYKAKYKDIFQKYQQLEQEAKHVKAKLQGSEAQLLRQSKNSRLLVSRLNPTSNTSRPGSNITNSRASSRDSVISASSRNTSIISQKPKTSSKTLKNSSKQSSLGLDSRRQIGLKNNSSKFVSSSRDSSLSEDTFNRSLSASANRISRSGLNSRASSNGAQGLSSARNSLLGSGTNKKASVLPQMHGKRSRSTEIHDQEASIRSHKSKRSSSRGKRQQDIDNITSKIEMLQKIVQQFNK